MASATTTNITRLIAMITTTFDWLSSVGGDPATGVAGWPAWVIVKLAVMVIG